MQPGDTFHLELVKLLLRVAWADHRVVRAEAELIRDLCRKLGVSTEVKAQVEVWLRQEHPAPTADMRLLKQNSRAVLAAVKTIVLADNRIAPEEAVMLAEIEASLRD
ncbi:MAG TPA: hypothetical protein VF331_23590 [Polyangiales bacterium]